MANVILSKVDYIAADDTGLTTLYPMISISIDDVYFTACASNHINLSLDNPVDYMEASINGKTIYKYQTNDQFNTSTQANANDMFIKWYDFLTKKI